MVTKLINKTKQFLNNLKKSLMKNEDKTPYIPITIKKNNETTEEKINRLGYRFIRVNMFKSIITIPVKKHKKKRIQKKFIKKYGYKTIGIPEMSSVILGNSIIGHPKAIDKFIKEFECHDK